MHHFINVKRVEAGVIDIFVGDDKEAVKAGNVQAVRKTERPVITVNNNGHVRFICGNVNESLQGMKNLFYDGQSLTDPRSQEQRTFEAKMDEIFNQ